jgi:hypothetical protein
VADVPGADGCCFNVLSTRKAFVLRAPSADEKAAWLAALETAIEEQASEASECTTPLTAPLFPWSCLLVDVCSQ